MRYSLLFALLVPLGASCSGAIGGGGGSGPDESGDDKGGGGSGAGSGTSGPGSAGATGTGGPAPIAMGSLGTLDKTDNGAVGPAPLRRLNRREYNNVVKDLVGDASAPASAWPAEAALTGFDTDAAGQGVGVLEVEQFMATAEIVARNAVANLTALTGCDPATAGEDACGSAFIDRLATRAYRRPVTAAEKGRLKVVLDHGRRVVGFAHGVRLVVEAVLQSPLFLYRVEVGEPVTAGAPRVALKPHELAARLSFFLIGTQPDDPLRAAADMGALATPAAIEQQARRLLAKPEARAMAASFQHQWLDLDRLESLSKDPKLYPQFTSRMVASLEAGARALAQHLYIERGDAPLSELLTAPYAFIDPTSARTYGITTTLTGTDVRKTTIKEPRAGLLTDAALMSALAGAIDTAPVARGVFVRKHLLCLDTPLPPDNMAIEIPPPNPQLTTRERFAMHRENPVCGGCHRLIDPIGFGFENYDAIGRYRETENGKPIDATGEVMGTASSDGPYRGAVELAQRLSKSREVPACLVDEWLAFALGRRAVTEDEKTVAALADFLGGSTGRMRELLVALTLTPAFRYRPPVVVGACQ